MTNKEQRADPIREFDSKANALQRGGMSRVEAVEEIKRTDPRLAAHYRSAMQSGHPSATTTRPATDDMMTRSV